MNAVAILNRVQGWVAIPQVEFGACLALASPLVISGVSKFYHFQRAINEVGELELQPAPVIAAAVIVTQIGGSVLFPTNRLCWLGAGVLAVFTLIATLLAHRFWNRTGLGGLEEMETFFEHMAIVGGLLVAAIYVNSLREI